jgi:hypothetical protein
MARARARPHDARMKKTPDRPRAPRHANAPRPRKPRKATAAPLAGRLDDPGLRALRKRVRWIEGLGTALKDGRLH